MLLVLRPSDFDWNLYHQLSWASSFQTVGGNSQPPWSYKTVLHNKFHINPQNPVHLCFHQYSTDDHMCACSVMSNSFLTHPVDCGPPGSLFMDFPGKNTGVGCHSLLKGVFSTQGLNPCHLHCTRLFITCHQGSPQLMMQVLKQLFGNTFLQRSYLECVHREGESFLSRELYIHDSKTKWDTARIYQDTMQASKWNQIPLVLKLVV